MEPRQSLKKRMYYLKVLLPTLLTISLFIISLFVIVIPRFENIIIDRKREMIRELTNTAVSMVDKWHQMELKNEISGSDAREAAIAQIQSLRYGEELKDYFWITDMHPNMIVHPYRPELNGKDLSHFKDSRGKKLFVEMIDTVKKSGGGYVDYMWQWKDDSSKIVPKLSHVTEFKPWGWIIGTGIYIEDVKEEIASLESKVITIAVVISIISSILLLYIAYQNLKSERLRKLAEDELRESREKYRMLVEASGEGLIMILENRQVYYNNALYKMLDYKEIIHDLKLDDVFVNYPGSKIFDFNNFAKCTDDETIIEQYETKLKKQTGDLLDVLLIISPISLMNSSGIILSVKDISMHKEISEELDYSKEKYLSLTNQLPIGVFRTTADRNMQFTEVNPAMINLLGAQSDGELLSASLLDFISGSDETENFPRSLFENGFIKNRILVMKNKPGKKLVTSVSAVLVKNSVGTIFSVDGIIEDITEQRKTEKEKEELITDLQTSVLMLNQSIKPYIKDIPFCGANDSVTEAVTKMTMNHSSAILIKGGGGEELGIITDYDIRERVLFGKADLNSAVYLYMSAPLTFVNSSATIYEALVKFREKRINQLIVKDLNNVTVGVLFDEDIFAASNSNYLFMIQNIENSPTINKITDYRDQLLLLVKNLIESDAGIKSITKIISLISDAVTKRIIQSAINELGQPPVKFAFITMGSEGREEQTLSTDQDNAIIYEDVPDDEADNVHGYFLKLGEKISDDLNTAGYSYCKGNIMAKNAKWCQPFSVWKKYFTDWVTSSGPQDLLEVKIFFDFRKVYGDDRLAAELKNYIDKLTGSYGVFFVYFAESLLNSEIPESMFKLKAPLDLKLLLLPIIDLARLYGLRYKLNKTGTLERLEQTNVNEVFSQGLYKNIIHSYNFLMQLRLKHQVDCISNRMTIDNYINPQNISDLETIILKRVFGLIEELKNKVRIDFKGTLSR